LAVRSGNSRVSIPSKYSSTGECSIFYTPSVVYSLKFNSNQLLAWRA
jgi:hypothetical protein